MQEEQHICTYVTVPVEKKWKPYLQVSNDPVIAV